jgi:signal transduction histidine kinase
MQLIVRSEGVKMPTSTPDYEELYRQQNEFMLRLARYLKLALLDTLKNGYSFLYSADHQFSEAEKARITKVFESIHPIMEQVNNFQDLTEILMDRKTVIFSIVSLRRSVNSILNSCRSLADAYPKIKFETEIPRELPVVKVDSHRFPQLVVNLIDNAFKFTEAGTVCLRVIPSETEALFQVQDSGIGIPVEKYGLVFEPFQTALENPDDLRAGFGLGLPIAKYLVEAHGGKLWFESQPGKGTSFFFTLPVHKDGHETSDITKPLPPAKIGKNTP